MMILSRIWYLVLAIVAALGMYVAYLAVGQYNRQGQVAADETLKSDTQVVNWALQIDARRRLESMVFASVDASIVKALKEANGKEAAVPQTARDEARKGITAVNEKLVGDYKLEAMLVVDREGRMVAQVGYDAAAGFNDFELGGYPAVNDGLHGYLRDDTWVWGNRVYRVFVRPVEDEVGQPPLGAIVGLKGIDNDFAKEMSKRTRANLAFYLGDQKVASAAQETFQSELLEDVSTLLPALKDDEAYKSVSGRSEIKPIGTKGAAAIFAKLSGEGGELRAGYAVVRQRSAVSGVMEFLTRADDLDKKNVKYGVLAALLILGIGLGLLFSFLEHSRPLKEFAVQGERLRKGDLDAFQLQRLGGSYRTIGANVNQGIERIIERGGGSRKPADLEAILGPVPAQPSMSAFSFPLPDSTGALPPSAPSSAGGPPPGFPAPPAGQPGPRAAPPPAKPIAAPPAKAGLRVPGVPPVPYEDEETQLRKEGDDEEDDQTKVGRAPKGLLEAASGSVPPPASGSGADTDPIEWRGIYESFIATKKQCNEPVDGLSYEKFRGTLAKNRDALVQRHKCARVKFTVYVKDGRASLKATPVRD
jgi:hypothetical protein